jgi:Ni,Fe-hydrogenase I large subunit
MNFETCIKEGNAKKVPVDKFLANSLIISSKQAIDTAKNIPISESSLKTILREVYEGLREYCEAIIHLYGYKVLDHVSITYFIKDVLKNEPLSNRFDRFRKLRNGVNYYGNDLNKETVLEALKEVPKMIKEMENYVRK